MSIIPLFESYGEEPTAAELAAIEAEWPQIAAELDVLDAEIAELISGPYMSEIDRRRTRRRGAPCAGLAPRAGRQQPEVGGRGMTAAFAAYLVALLVAHTVADHWIQTHHQAMCKAKPGLVGVLACLRHVATYTATTAVFGLLVWQVLDLELSWLGFLAGQVPVGRDALPGRPPGAPGAVRSLDR